jgi:hypothetical protein
MNSNRIFKITLWSIFLLAGSANGLQAQQASATFEGLRSDLGPMLGQSIEITEGDGAKHRGKVVAFSRDTITLARKGVQRDFTESKVREIRRAGSDKLWNGVLIGVGVGAAATVIGVSQACGRNDSECNAIVTAVFAPIFMGGGAGIGALIDAGFKKNETVFLRPNSQAARGPRISPILDKNTKGVRLAFSF